MSIPFLCQNSTLIVNLTFDNIRLLIEERLSIILLTNIHNEVLVTLRVRNCTYGRDFPRVQFFCPKFLHTRLSVGGASLLDNWILAGDEQGN